MHLRGKPSSLHLVMSIESSLSASLSSPPLPPFSLSLSVSPLAEPWLSFRCKGGKSAISRSARSSIKGRRREFSMSASGFSRCLFLFSSPLLFFFFSDLLVVDVSLSIVENNRTCSWHRSWPTGCWYSFAMKFSFARWNNLRGNCFYEIDISMSFLLPILFFFSFREIIFAQLFFLKFKSLEGLIGDLRITYSRFLSSFIRYGGEKSIWPLF